MRSELSFSYNGCYTKVKEPSLHEYLPIPRWRILFPTVLSLSETASSGIWTRITVSISYGGNHCTTNAYKSFCIDGEIWIEWKSLCGELCQGMASCAMRHEICWGSGKCTHLCMLLFVEAGPKREVCLWWALLLYATLTMSPSSH